MSITVGASSISGFQPNALGVDTALTGVSVTLNDDQVTFANPLPAIVVGLSGFKISLGTPAVTYTVESVESRTALTLTTPYLATTGTVTGTLHKFVLLRVYVLNPFTPFGESYVAQSGAPNSTAWFRRYGVSVISDGAQNVAHIPEIVLPATTDSSVPTARYFAGLYTQGNAFIQAFPGCVDQWQLNHLTTPTSWAQICDFNTPSPPAPVLNPESFYTKQQIDARFPSGLADQLLYFESAGNVLDPLTLGAEFQITAGVLEFSGQFGVTRIQEEGVNLPQQNTANFVGSAFTAADDPGNNRTNITADADLNALASNVTNGYWVRTGAGTGAARTITGTANEITSTNGDGGVGNTVLSLPAALTFTGKTVTGGTFSAPTITGGTHTAITGLGVRSTGSGAFDLQIVNTENLTGNRALTITLNDAARTVNLGGNLTLAGAFTTSGANSLTFTTSGATNVTVPMTGTLATLAGTETFTNKTLTSPGIGTSILDTNGNELFTLNAIGSAVSEVSITNAITGVTGPIIGVSSGDTNVNLNINAKGTGRVVIKGYPFCLENNTTATGNITTGLDSLHSYSLPANSLVANGDFVEVHYGGTFAVNDADKRIQITADSQVAFNSGLKDIDFGVWRAEVTYTRVSATSLRASGFILMGQIIVSTNGAIDTANSSYDYRAINATLTVANLTSNAITLLVQAEGTNTDDIVQNESKVKLTQR